MIYIASPYSSPIEGAQQLRFEKVRRFAVHLHMQGIVAFSPIVYGHCLASATKLRTDAQAWFRWNTDILRHSEALFVLMLPGWEQSKGVSVEIRQAKALLLPIVYHDEEFNVVRSEEVA